MIYKILMSFTSGIFFSIYAIFFKNIDGKIKIFFKAKGGNKIISIVIYIRII